MITVKNAQVIGLDELPKYSTWFPYLLGIEKSSHSFAKTKENILREYGDDKWGNLLKRLSQENNLTIDEADIISSGMDRIVAFYSQGKLLSGSLYDVNQTYFDLVHSVLSAEKEKTNHYIELGAGYGTIIFKLAKAFGFEDYSYTAAEFTDTGVKCMQRIASDQDWNIQIGHCDLASLDLSHFDISSGSVFFTSWTMACLKGFSRTSLHALLERKPSMVYHSGSGSFLYVCEPIKEHAKLKYGNERHWGYTEDDALRYFLENIHTFFTQIDSICIRLHPSEPQGKYDAIVSAFNLPITFGGKGTLLQEIVKHNTIVGCETMAMVVGLLANKRVVSSIPPGGHVCRLPQKEIEMLREKV